jgi:predicted phosphoribosyltransferase
MPGGTYFKNEYFIELKCISKYIQNKIQLQMNEIQRRLREFRINDTYDRELEGKMVILVDDD